MAPRTILTIAGHDPSSGAGITADLQVFAAHGFFGTSCVTALTAQSTTGVTSTTVTNSEFLAESLRVLAADMPPAGVKIGMLGSAESVRSTAQFLANLPEAVPVVLDPVIRSSSGRELLSTEGVWEMRFSLLQHVHWITPNWAELAALTGEPCTAAEDVERLGATLKLEHPRLGLIATGGDNDPPVDYVQLPAGNQQWIAGERIDTTSTHGTGCAFSSAFLCALLRGLEPMDAAQYAKKYVEQGMRSAPGLGSGRGPMNLLWPLRK